MPAVSAPLAAGNAQPVMASRGCWRWDSPTLAWVCVRWDWSVRWSSPTARPGACPFGPPLSYQIAREESLFHAGREDYKYAPDPETGNDPELTLIFQKRVPIDYEDVSTDMIAERVLLAKARGEAVPEINGYEHYDPRFLPQWERAVLPSTPRSKLRPTALCPTGDYASSE